MPHDPHAVIAETAPQIEAGFARVAEARRSAGAAPGEPLLGVGSEEADDGA